MITIIDIGMGNLGSIQNMLSTIRIDSRITSSTGDIERAERLILPGVGSFDVAMRNLRDSGLIPVLNRRVFEDKIPILGICLGVQLFGKKSEEGVLPGLGWIEAESIRFKFGSNHAKLRIPHMGWNTITPTEETSIFRDMYKDARFYFVHSYHLVCDDEKDILSTTLYGYDFPSSIRKNNIFGTQFHPEKSHKFGMRLLKNFAELT
jgi:imidazole glycerol-phosphate synthase subunit HisH